MEQVEWNRFLDWVSNRIGSRMYDDVTPAEIVTWLLSTWDLDRERPSKDAVLRYCLEHLAADIKQRLPTWWQIHEGLVTGKNPYECERKITPRPPGAGIFLGTMEELRADVVRNGLRVIEGNAPPPA